MNQKDFKIIANLRTDARMSLTTMSRKTSIPVSTIFDRLKVTENDFIVKHTTLLNFKKLGYHTIANITLKVDRDCKDQLKDYLLKNQNVNSVYKINNGFDFMVEGVFKQINDLELFIDELEKRFKILDKKYFFIIEDLKREAFMSNPDLLIAQ